MTEPTTEAVGPTRIKSAWEASLNTRISERAEMEWDNWITSLKGNTAPALQAIDDVAHTFANGHKSAKPGLAELKAAYMRRAFCSDDASSVTLEACSTCGFTGYLAVILCSNANWGETRGAELFKMRYFKQELEAKTYQYRRHYWRHLLPCACELGKAVQRHTGFSAEQLRNLQPWVFTWNWADAMVIKLQGYSDHLHYGAPLPRDLKPDPILQSQLQAIIDRVVVKSEAV